MSPNASPSRSEHNPGAAALQTLRLPARMQSLATLAVLLEKLDREPRAASAAQYRRLTQQITALLADTPQDDALDALLDIAPATAELYENLRYAQSGLCRSPLDDAVNAELSMRAALRHWRQPGAAPAADPGR